MGVYIYSRFPVHKRNTENESGKEYSDWLAKHV